MGHITVACRTHGSSRTKFLPRAVYFYTRSECTSVVPPFTGVVAAYKNRNTITVRYVAAYLLATLGGNSSPSSDDIKKILGSVGIEAEDDKLNKVISELKGKNIEELIAEGNSKLAAMPAGGAVAAAGGGGGAPAAEAAEEKKEEAAKKEESEEESDDDMGFGLFD